MKKLCLYSSTVIIILTIVLAGCGGGGRNGGLDPIAPGIYLFDGGEHDGERLGGLL